MTSPKSPLNRPTETPKTYTASGDSNMPSRTFTRRALSLATASALLSGAAFTLAAPAYAAVEATVTFNYTGNQESWTVPSGITSLTVEVAGAQGHAGSGEDGAHGGSVLIDLGITFAGEELSVLVGGEGLGSVPRESGINYGGGGGSFLAHGDEFLAVAGGGGGSGLWIHRSEDETSYSEHGRGPLKGGVGGAGNTPAGDAEHHFLESAAGKGADGLMPGEPGIGYGGPSYQGETGTIAAISPDGIITPGLGGSGGHVSGAGGGGLAGGGGGSNDVIWTWEGPSEYFTEVQDDYGAGGGGSGYLAPDLTLLSTGTNTGHGSVTFTYTLPAVGLAPEFVTIPTDQAVMAGEAIELVTVTAAGAPTPTLSLEGDLPPGVTFDPATGVLSGAPTLAGNFTFTITATNGIGPDATATSTVSVTPAPLALLNITPSVTSVDEGGSVTFTVDGTDQFGNIADVSDVTLTSDVATDEVNGFTVTFPYASQHTITASAPSGVTASATVEVIPASAPPAPTDPETESPAPSDPVLEVPESSPSQSSIGDLAATGVNTMPLTVGAGLMLLTGGAVLLWARRRSAAIAASA